VLLAGVAALLAVWLVRPLWYDPESARLKRDLLAARKTLEGPDPSADELAALAGGLVDRMDRVPGLLGDVHFVVGSLYVRLADRLPQARAAEIYLQARSHLEQAESHGLSESDHTQLLYGLAKTWFHTGADPQHIIDYLTLSADQVEPLRERASAYGMLAQAYLRLPAPDIRAALAANEKQLQLPIEDENVLALPRLFRAQLLLMSPDPAARASARRALARISPSSPPEILAQARYLRAGSYQQDGAWAEAAALWEQVLTDPNSSAPSMRRVLYSLGVCYRNLNRATDATPIWARTIKEGGEEAKAAMLYLAETQLKENHFSETISLYRTALAGINKSADYNSSLVPLTEAARLVESACQGYREAAHFDNARELANLHAKLADPGPAQGLVGEVEQGWAHAKQTHAEQLKGQEAAAEAQKAFHHFNEAGLAFETAADATVAKRAQIEWLWRSGSNYLQGQDFIHAVSVFERFVKLAPAAERISEAWFRLGQAHRALHNDSAADPCFLRCIEYPGPFAYRARYELGVVRIDRGKLDEAEEFLQQNLALIERDPDAQTNEKRDAHEKSLYTLARLLFRRGKYHMAAKRWEQALALYPANSEVVQARYLLAECYRRLADIELQNLRPGEAVDTQPHYHRQYVLWLETAAANYQKLKDDLETRRASGAMTGPESKMLLQALFELAECRFDRGQYAEAIRLYEDLASRYQGQVEGLIALKQLFRCELVAIPLDKAQLDKALGTLQRSRLFLETLGDSAFANRPETESRAAWETWIKQSETQLKKLGLTSPEAK
jgi:tetratricopeptide (TPR) repeat protein